jgi:hypothetical protein
MDIHRISRNRRRSRFLLKRNCCARTGSLELLALCIVFSVVYISMR